MKLFFDENLSPKFLSRLSDVFPNSLHIRDVDMKAKTDLIVWDYAKDNDLIIVSKNKVYIILLNFYLIVWLSEVESIICYFYNWMNFR